jgi:hypothetical protein
MRNLALGLLGLLVLVSAACSDRGTVVADMNASAGSSGAGVGSGTGGVTDTGGVAAETGGKSSGTGGKQEATGGTHGGDGGSSAGGTRAQNTGGTPEGSAGDTGAVATGGGHASSSTGGGGTTGGAGGSGGRPGAATGGTAGSGGESGGRTGGTGGTSSAAGASDGGAAGAEAEPGSAGSTACTTDECCASVEVTLDALTVYLVDEQFYFDGTVELVDGPLDLNGWLATVELSSQETGAVEGPMAYANVPADRTDWVGSPGSAGSGVECGQTLTFQVRVRTDTTLRDPQGSTSECAGVYGPSVTVEAKIECPTCPADAQAAEYDEETCLYPVTLHCRGQTSDMSGKPVTVDCPCDLSRQPRRWACPVF